MKKIFAIILCGLMLGAFAFDALAFRGQPKGGCAIASCCCTPSIKTPVAKASGPYCMDLMMPNTNARATCCQSSSNGQPAMDFVLPTTRTATIHLHLSGMSSAISQNAFNDRFTGGGSRFRKHTPPLSTDIPIYLATLSIRC